MVPQDPSIPGFQAKLRCPREQRALHAVSPNVAEAEGVDTPSHEQLAQPHRRLMALQLANAEAPIRSGRRHEDAINLSIKPSFGPGLEPVLCPSLASETNTEPHDGEGLPTLTARVRGLGLEGHGLDVDLITSLVNGGLRLKVSSILKAKPRMHREAAKASEDLVFQGRHVDSCVLQHA